MFVVRATKGIFQALSPRQNPESGADLRHHALAGSRGEDRLMAKQLSKEHKARMQEGRRLAKAKKIENIIPGQEKARKVKKEEVRIMGYIIDHDYVLPVFPSEVSSIKGTMYKTAHEAKEHLK